MHLGLALACVRVMRLDQAIVDRQSTEPSLFRLAA